ncbi:cysteine desulfurase family protein [Georgenia sp. AZ-5]|uniref:cysteine desulfurase family protein n=1 Tax=Georgenia sp. AZ-5 TaxID=3367526 RepID=UPI0037551938
MGRKDGTVPIEQTTSISARTGLPGRPVYLDHNATTPVDPRVLDALLPVLREGFGNPSSDHAFGDLPRAALAKARRQVAGLLGARPEEVVFTGSGSEADALAIRGAALAAVARGVDRPHVVTQVTEHPAVLAACRALEAHGVETTYLPVDRHGRVDPADVEAAITGETVLVTVMHANNETGTVQPIREIARVTHARGVLLHCDAAQSAGKLPVDVGELGADLLTVVGHKMYAPKGIAALYVRDGVPLVPLVGGGGQERGLRAGTENVAFAVALGAAAEIAAAALEDGEAERLAAVRDLLHRRLAELLPRRVHLHGHPSERLPNTLNVRIDGVAGHEVLAAAPSVAASTGSACHSGTHEPSPVLTAMGLAPGDALGAVRLSVGRWTGPEDVERAAAALAAGVRTLDGAR